MNAAMTITALSTADAFLDAFATAGSVLPREALKQAKDRWAGRVLMEDACICSKKK